MSANAWFLVSFVVGGFLMLAGLSVDDWLRERKFNRELRAVEDQRAQDERRK